jgi:hypothetical protein
MLENHAHSEYATLRDVNGFGDRVNRIEVNCGSCKSKVERNEEDIQDIFKMIEKNAEAIGKLNAGIATLTGRVVGYTSGAVAILGVVYKMVEIYLKSKGA